jgi:hypothetical protein
VLFIVRTPGLEQRLLEFEVRARREIQDYSGFSFVETPIVGGSKCSTFR